MNKQLLTTAGAMGLLLAVAPASHATILGFGQIGGSNTAIQTNYGSNATADNFGVVVSNGTTPNITLTWDANWDIHQSGHFAELEDHTVGGGDWDNEGNGPRIAQLDGNLHTLDFAADAGFALVLNSFDFGNTEENITVSTWDLTLTDASSNVVWSQTVVLDNNATDVVTVTPNFTGALGASYTLTFEGISGGAGDGTPLLGRHGVDNLSFGQTDVPEPGSLALLGLGGLA
ncbi:MAG: PEP-CTERM sorting domain-containing protein, partial [Phycisphaerales bacterium JB063]